MACTLGVGTFESYALQPVKDYRLIAGPGGRSEGSDVSFRKRGVMSRAYWPILAIRLRCCQASTLNAIFAA